MSDPSNQAALTSPGRVLTLNLPPLPNKCQSFLSPIFDYTNLPFRLLCQKYGADAACVPLVNAAAIIRDKSKLSLVDANPKEKNLGVQLVGNDAFVMGKAAHTILNSFPFVSWLNINCGCPSERTRESGGGSALLSKPRLICNMVSEMRRHVDAPISVKLRLLDHSRLHHDRSHSFDATDATGTTLSLCKSLESAGVDFIIVHGRTVKQGYSGKADWGTIAKLKENLSVPVIGNGDLQSAADGHLLIRQGACDGFMMGRAAMSNPLAFSGRTLATVKKRFRLVDEYLSLHQQYLGIPAPLHDAKTKALNLTKGLPEAASLRNKISRSTSVGAITELLSC